MTASHGPLYFDSTIDGHTKVTCDCGEETSLHRDRSDALLELGQHMREVSA